MHHVTSSLECNFYTDLFNQRIARHEKWVSCKGNYLRKFCGLVELMLRDVSNILCSVKCPTYMILVVCLIFNICCTTVIKVSGTVH